LVLPRFCVNAIDYTVTETGVKIGCYTFAPCHLWLRWTTTEPRIHPTLRVLRGYPMPAGLRFCFTSYEDNEQEEAGDTLYHTFTKEPWPVCQTRYFYFYGQVGGFESPSTSGLFDYHRVAPPITKVFYPDVYPGVTSNDGTTRSYRLGVVWLDLIDEPGYNAYNDFGNYYLIQMMARSTPWQWSMLYRSFFLFDTSVIPPGAQILSATLEIYGGIKGDANNIKPDICLYSAAPASNTELVKQDHDKVGTIPFSNIITYDDWKLDGFNIFTLNPAGISALAKGGITKFSTRNANYEVARHTPAWSTSGASHLRGLFAEGPEEKKPRLTVTYKE